MHPIRIESSIQEGQTLGEKRAVRVTVIRGGASANGYYYREEVLRAIAQKVEGAQAYVDHATNVPTRSVRDMVGFYCDAVYVPPDADAGETQGRVDATLHILEAGQWLWSLIREACILGRPELIGLSVDIYGTLQPLSEAGGSRLPLPADRKRTLQEVTGVLTLNSCDVVTKPSAGGTFQRVLQSMQRGAMLMQNKDEMETPSSASIESNEAHPHAEERETAPTVAVGQEHIMEEMAMVPTRLLEELRLERAHLTLERRLQEAALPEAVERQVRSRYTGRVFEIEELEHDLAGSRQMLADLTRAGLVRGHGYAKPELGMQVTEAEKIQAAFDAMFGLEVETARVGNVRGFTSIREAFARVTGDASVSDITTNYSQLGQIRVSEAAPLVRITEADTTTASFAYLLGTSMNKRLLKDYQAWPAEWQKFCTVVPIRDFKQQSRVRLGAFGSLPIVAEDTAYSAVSLTDTAATYVPQKRGNLVTVSREVIINDDLMAIKQLPTKLATAAAYTLAEFVYSFLSSNANIYDGSPLFTTGAPHTNLGTAALSTGSMQLGVTAMREQTNFAGKRIGLRPRFLIVPPELEWVSMVVTKSAGVPGSNNNDINPMLGYVTPIVSPQLTSTTQWFMVADPQVVDTIEVGFVGGQINPALFIQDFPLYGLNFTQDAISYKVRQEYGAAVVDYRGLYRGI